MSVKTVRVKYKCSSCDAEDSPLFFEGEPQPTAFNCWNCKSGKGLELMQQIQKKVGMFKVATA